MKSRLTWEDAQEIGIRLFELHPELAPLSVRFTELHRMVCALEGFSDDPKASNEGRLEAIQMVWYEEWQDAKD